MESPKISKIRKDLDEPVQLNLDVKIQIPRTNQVSKKKYVCSCCGSSWDTQKSHFLKSASPLYQSNNGFITVCNTCRDNYYYKLVDLYNGNEAHAVKHFCQQFDIIFHKDALFASRQTPDSSRISSYLSKKNLGQTARIGITYTDGMKYDYQEQLNNVINSRDELKSKDSSVSASAIDRWGVGFTELDYKNLDDHYKMLKDNNPNADSNQEIFIKTLCNLNMLMVRALQAGESKEYTSLAEQYAKTFKQAGLKTVQEKDNTMDECLGVTLATISQYTPEEYYKDKTLYDDWDHIGEYFDRFVKRPLKNLMFGTNERDSEYYVKEVDELDE